MMIIYILNIGILNFNLGKEKYVWLYINSSMDRYRYYIIIVELYSLSFISLHFVCVQENHLIVMALGSTHTIKQ